MPPHGYKSLISSPPMTIYTYELLAGHSPYIQNADPYSQNEDHKMQTFQNEDQKMQTFQDDFPK